MPRNAENLVVQGAASAFKVLRLVYLSFLYFPEIRDALCHMSGAFEVQQEACRPFPTMRFICEHRIPFDKAGKGTSEPWRFSG